MDYDQGAKTCSKVRLQAELDFILTSSLGTKDIHWSSVLIIGEHICGGSSLNSALEKRSAYVEEVFLAQPFRAAVIGVLTSNNKTTERFWRFD